MATFGRIKNWSEFQHYKDRAPPWIKLHHEFLDDFEFSCLPLASKALAPMLWLLASESKDGSVRVDVEWLSFRLRWPTSDVVAGLKPLCDAGFVVVAIEVLAACLHGACLEGEGEGETKGEKQASLVVAKQATAECPHDEIIAMYHDLLPANPRVRAWTGTRQSNLRARWREDAKRQHLDYWRRLLAYAGQSPFLTGQRSGQDGRAFLPGLDWLVKPENFAKLIEGRYHDKPEAA